MTDSAPLIPEWRRGALTNPARTENALNAATYAIQRLKELRIPFPDNSRLERAVGHVRAIHEGADGPSDEFFAEAVRTIFEIYWISRALGSHQGRPDKNLTNSLARMLGGPDLPGDEDQNTSRPRNTQFELFVGAWFAAGGVWVQNGEPDVRIRILGQELGVAAKRVQTRKKILQRVSEAADQIESRKGLGIVAVNVDRLLEELPNTDDQRVLGEQFDSAFPEYDQALAMLLERPRIGGLIGLGMRLGLERRGSGRHLNMALFCKYRAFTTSEAESEAMNQFWTTFDQIQRDRLSRF